MSKEPVRTSRTVESIHPATPASDGAGVRLLRNLAPDLQTRLDPFLLLDEFHSDDPNDYIAGFPDHPHRGFETVTYLLAGIMEHRDSGGNAGTLRSGGVQWMKAGRGVIHSEMPKQEDGLMRGFQLWLNLPSDEKMDSPNYQDLSADQIPRFDLPSGGSVTIVAGESHGVSGPVQPRTTQPMYLDVRLPAGGSFAQPIPDDHNALVYVYDGDVTVEGTTVPAEHLAVLAAGGDGVRLSASARSGCLLLSGKPIGESIVQYGPFVMNTKEEVAQAFADYQSGKLTQ